MTNDRFKYRIYDVENNRYVDNPEDFVPWDLPDGLIAEQCTGLKDKNGKLIYEGDIVFVNGEKWCVIWTDEDGAFFFSNLKEVYHQPIFQDFYAMDKDFKVIGNIHENQELLK